MGLPPRKAHHNPPRGPRRPRSLALPRLPQHGAVPLRRHRRQRLPLRLNTKGRLRAARDSLAPHPRPARPRSRHKQPRLAVWLRQPRPH